jgi:hypothetical protein
MAGRFLRAWRRADVPQVAGAKGIPVWAQTAPRVETLRSSAGRFARAIAQPGNADPMVTSGAVLSCSLSMGAPGVLNVLPPTRAANVNDGAPMINVSTFGVCASPANPEVAAATAAALGVLTPMPCIPVTSAWNGGSPNIQVAGAPALQPSSTIQCAWCGLISIQASQY